MNLFKIMQGIRSLAQAGKIDYQGAIKYLNDLGVQMDGIVKQALDNVFKKGKARDPDFGDTVVKMQIDEQGIPYNPKTLTSIEEKRLGIHPDSDIAKSIKLEKKGKKLADSMSDTEIELRSNFPKASDDEIKIMLEKEEGIGNLFEETTKVAKEPKYGTLDYDRIAKQEGVDVEEIRGKSFREIIEYLSAVRDKADGGRVGFQQGGWADNLTGQAAAIYQSMNLGGHSDATIQNTLKSLGYWDGDTGGGGVENIINTQQSIIPGAGGGGGGGPTGPDSYTQTWTSAGIPTAVKTQTQPIGLTAAEQAWREGPFYGPKQNIGMAQNTLDDSIRVQALAPADAPPGFFEGSIEGELDYTIPGTSQIFDPNTRKQYQTPRTIGDQVYAQSLIDKETGIKTLGVPPARTGVLGMWDKTKDFFSGLGSPKVRGTLGTRLANQPRIPLPASIAGWSLSPFNEASRNYNPNFVDQLNFLEMQDNMIGRDPNSGHLKYGPESVLAGKNVISLFGTNDYEAALEKEKERLKNILEKNKNKWSRDKIKGWKAKFWDPLIKEQQNAGILAAQRKEAEDKKKKLDELAKITATTQTTGGDGPGSWGGHGSVEAYDKSQADTYARAVDRHRGTSSNTGGWSPGSGNQGTTPGAGLHADYRRGGLATMFTRRR